MYGDSEEEIRHNLIMMNEMLNGIINDSKIPMPDIEEVDLNTSEDFQKMGDMILGKMALIESCCKISGIFADKKYNPRAIREKITVKKRQLVDLENENAGLKLLADKQEKQLEHMGTHEAQKNEQQKRVLELRGELHDAQKEIKSLEEQRRKEIESNNKRRTEFKGQDQPPLPKEQAEKRDKEKRIYTKKMDALKEEEKELLKRKRELEEELEEKEKLLKAIHTKQSKQNRFVAKSRK